MIIAMMEVAVGLGGLNGRIIVELVKVAVCSGCDLELHSLQIASASLILLTFAFFSDRGSNRLSTFGLA
jgi:hypothetical protein